MIKNKLKYKPYRLAKLLDNGTWKYIESYESTLEAKYHEDIHDLRCEGWKLKVVKKEYFGDIPIFEDK